MHFLFVCHGIIRYVKERSLSASLFKAYLCLTSVRTIRPSCLISSQVGQLQAPIIAYLAIFSEVSSRVGFFFLPFSLTYLYLLSLITISRYRDKCNKKERLLRHLECSSHSFFIFQSLLLQHDVGTIACDVDGLAIVLFFDTQESADTPLNLDL